MTLGELFIIAVGLSMDAFAVAKVTMPSVSEGAAPVTVSSEIDAKRLIK